MVQSPVGIETEEFAARRMLLADECLRLGATGCVLFDADYVRYYSGWVYLATERPVAMVVLPSGSFALFVPEFEAAHAIAKTSADSLGTYPEYPGKRHPMVLLADFLRDLGVTRTLASDQNGYPGILGYHGPALSQVTEAVAVDISPFVERSMMTKSEAEIACIRESGRWCAEAHRRLQAYSTPGEREAAAGLRASSEATLAMLEALGDAGGRRASTDGASAGYRGQIGVHSALAHAVTGNYEFKPGDVLVSETSAPVWGYNAELERTMIIGEPTGEQVRLFGHMRAAQEEAKRALRPGVLCSDVDASVLRYFEENGLLDAWGQHTGHAIGLRNHEAPFLDVGDHTRVEPGMVFTLEPGIYVRDFAGFRNSDTVVVTPDGIDVLTQYPSELQDLIIPI